MPTTPKQPRTPSAIVPPLAPDTPSPSAVDAYPKAAPKRQKGARSTLGVWVHYWKHVDEDPHWEYAIGVSLHADELAARTAAMDAEIPGKVVFVPWDGSITEAIV